MALIVAVINDISGFIYSLDFHNNYITFEPPPTLASVLVKSSAEKTQHAKTKVNILTTYDIDLCMYVVCD